MASYSKAIKLQKLPHGVQVLSLKRHHNPMSYELIVKKL